MTERATNLGNESGQTLLEFVIVVPVLAVAIAGTFWLLRATARRTECARAVFESVHAAVHQESRFSIGLDRVVLRRTSEGVEGWKTCGDHTERLFLPYLGRRNSGV